MDIGSHDHYADKHDTGREKCGGRIAISMFWMLGGFPSHGNSRRCRRNESSDCSGCEDASLISHRFPEEESRILDSRHHDDKKPDTMRIEKLRYENWMSP
jgi:hypothetical protein